MPKFGVRPGVAWALRANEPTNTISSIIVKIRCLFFLAAVINMNVNTSIERLRNENLNLLKQLQRGQSILNAAIHRGSPASHLAQPRDLCPLEYKPTPRSRRPRITSTPRLDDSLPGTVTKLLARRPVLQPVHTNSPHRLYESFTDQSSCAVESPLRRTPGRPATKSLIDVRQRSYSSPGRTPRLRPGRNRTPVSVQLETSSLLPSQDHARLRYGYQPPLELAHEESYYQLNRESPMKIRGDRLRRHMQGRILMDDNELNHDNRTHGRPKSILLTPGTKLNKSRNKVSFRGSRSSPITPTITDSSAKYRSQPLLGYDWIAGLLDAEQSGNEHSETFFEELKKFRHENQEACFYSPARKHDNTSAGLQRAPNLHHVNQSPINIAKHTCTHNYTVNSRLFAVPLQGGQDGRSLCAICNDRREAKPPGNASPSYIRVSVPRSTLANPYKLRPHRRSSYDPTDSVGLSQHCLAGWQNSKPSMMPTASNIDLKDSLDLRATQSTLNLKSSFHEPSSRNPKRSSSWLSKHTQDLLDRSNNLRLDLRKLERVGVSIAER